MLDKLKAEFDILHRLYLIHFIANSMGNFIAQLP
ncbi:hypothetical protein swp_4637 [Shewanella piezotolerans WP3]|uniref:Uncharacterized protein n=1 Tax=Shewanella piezotolerans (strain WP3 / JCM 13877) TaxID=225849 RepID=B8CTN2_SHEPW|nr:hypothetical protein swp_4637 [Shewanella piezotolerans WP3]